jgi:hypothetical protein
MGQINATAAIGLLLFSLTGCGGGGGGSSSDAGGPTAPAAPKLELVAGGPASDESRDGIGASARFVDINRIVPDDAGALYVADYHRVRRIATDTAVSTLLTLDEHGNTEVTAVALDRSGTVYVGATSLWLAAIGPHFYTGSILRLTGLEQSSVVRAEQCCAIFAGVGDLTVDPTGGFTVPEYDPDRLPKVLVVRLSAGGQVTQAGPTFNEASVPAPVAGGNSGEVYFAVGNVIHRFGADSVTTTVATLATRAGGIVPVITGLALDAAGNLYASDSAMHVVHKVTPQGADEIVVGVAGSRGFVAGALPAGLDAPVDVAVSGTNLYIAMRNGVAVVRNRP